MRDLGSVELATYANFSANLTLESGQSKALYEESGWLSGLVVFAFTDGQKKKQKCHGWKPKPSSHDR